MKVRLHTLPAAVALVMLGLILGSVGTATAAGGVTAAQVRKIATSVVGRLAPQLSVAHADTADDATTLAGRPAIDYLNRSYTFAPPSNGQPRETRTFSLSGLPQGTYLFTYDLNTSVSAPDVVVTCFVRLTFNQGFTNQAVSNGVPNAPSGQAATRESNTGTFLVTVGSDQPKLYCGASSRTSANPTFAIGRQSSQEDISTLVFTKVDDARQGTITEDTP